MAHAPLGAVLRHIRTLAGAASARRLTDLHLLRRFADTQDEDAFAELMRRHGPLVLSVCRRVLGHEQDAEDAFQAAFLVLARKAASIRKRESVGSFLHGVAYRIAMKERGKLAQRRQREKRAERPMPAGPVHEAAFRELQMLLDEGLNRLPEKYRTPFVLCCLQGKSKNEAARDLGWKEGTVSSRLAQARKKLQQFLSRRGVTVAAVLTATGIGENTASACVPPLLAAAAVRATMLFASGSSAAMETAKVVQLAETALRSMAALPWKTATALLLAVSLAVGGAGMACHVETSEQAPASEAPKTPASASRQLVREQEKPRTDRYGDPLPEGALVRLGTIRFRQGYFTRQVAFLPDGKTLVCAGAGRGLCLWDATTGRELRQITQMAHALSFALSPDGKKIACTFDGTKGDDALYEIASGRKILELPGPRFHRRLAYAPDGKTIAAEVGPGSAVHLIDADSGAKREAEVSCGEDSAFGLTWSPDSRKLAWIGQKGLIHLCDAVTGKEIAVWKGHDKPAHGLAFSPDGKILATGGMDETIRLWDVATHKELHVLSGKHQYVRTVVFSHDGRLLASGHGDGAIALWDVDKGRLLPRWQAHSFTVTSLDFSPDNKRLVSGAFWECGPRLWDVATGAEIRPFAAHTAPVERLLFSPDGTRIRSLGREKKIWDWDLMSGRETLRFQWPSSPAAGVWDALTLSPQGDVVASRGNEDGTIRLWDTATGKEQRTLGKFPKGDQGRFYAEMEFSPDGRLLAIGTKDGMVSIWDAAVGRERQQLKKVAGLVLCLAFTRDGQKIAAGTARGRPTIALWDVKTGKSLAEFSSTERIDRLVFSPDGKILATASWTRTAPRLWDAATGRLLRTLEAPTGLYDLAFSPDGKWLAGAGEDQDQKVHVWEVSTGLKVRTFRGHISSIMSVAFAPDGRSLASGGADSSILLWDFTGRMKDGRLQTAKWTPRELEKRWIDLAIADGQRAVQSLWDLVASPEQTVPLLRQRIKPIEPADAQRVERLIRDLDSEDFPKRTKATEELEKIVDGAESVLRKKLTEKPSLEMRQRINQVLGKLEPSVPGERLRGLRAVQILEYVGTSEAREYLRALAKGLPNARLTREAQTALERLAK